VTASVSTFAPKPHTPFQWAAQIDLEETRARQTLLRRELTRRRIRFKWHDGRLSLLEGIFSRGDRRLGRLVLAAQRAGCRFDGWTEQCRWDLWQAAMAECGVDPAFYLRRRLLDEALPWDHLYSGVTKKYLRQELARAVNGVLTPDCSIERCTYCGACDFQTVRNVSYHLRGAKGGTHRGTEIDGWAHAQLPEVEVWETRSWREAQIRRATRDRRAAEARGAVAPAETILDPVAVERDPTRDDGPPAPHGDGNAEEWLEVPPSALHPSDPRHAAPATAARHRVRLRYSKQGPARFIGSRELAELFYRATRRAELPVAFSQGYHPLPRLSFGPGLPVGIASDDEYVDLELASAVAAGTVARRLDAELPRGLRILGAWSTPVEAPGVGGMIRGCRYLVKLPPEWMSDRLAERVAAFEQAPSYPVAKRAKGGGMKAVDARASASLRVVGDAALEVEIRAVNGSTVPVGALVGTLLGLPEDRTKTLDVTKAATLFTDTAAAVGL
jgi:radical SAM-linked protein